MDSGSIEEVTELLKSWCTLHDHGLVRVEWDSAYARQEVVERLNKFLPLVEIELPPGEAGYETAARLIEKLQARSGSVVSITGIEWAFPQGGNRLETLAALSFQRETLAALPVRQIWWVPSSLTERFVLGVPDLDSWFRLKLHLTEVPPLRAVERTEGKTVSVMEARSVARRFWERLESARAQNVSEERIWAELAQPAVDALLSAGLEREADAILASTPDVRGQLEKNLQELLAVRGPVDPEVLALIARLSRLLRDHGDFTGARRLQEQVLDATTRVLGEEHPETITSMNELALTLGDQGDYAAARRLHEKALELQQRHLGEEHADTLSSMNNLAWTVGREGDHATARGLQERALAVRTRVWGEEHPDTLLTMNNLADTLRSQGDLLGARRLQERVLEVSTRLLGEEHPRTLTSMSNLAVTLGEEHDQASARRLEERALEVRVRVLGEEHPDTLTSMHNLAVTLWAQGDHARAINLLRKSIAGQRRVLGAEHPDTVATAELLRDWEAQQ